MVHAASLAVSDANGAPCYGGASLELFRITFNL
jgi:hypothetical protein